MLAVVYETFTRIEKDKFRKLLIHRRKACQHAFRLLVPKSRPTKISFRHFSGLLSFYKPRASKLDRYLMFKALDMDRSSYLTLDEFYKVFEVTELNWNKKYPEGSWYSDLKCHTITTLCEKINKLVLSKWFAAIVYVTIAGFGFWQIVVSSTLSESVEEGLQKITNSPVTVIFVTFYVFEVFLKVIAFGIFQYFESAWNIFDFVVTVLCVTGLIMESLGTPFSFIFILRSLRLLKLFELKARYRDIMGTFMFIIMKRFGSVSVVVMIVYYFFAILGMELFSDYDLINCCKNSSVEQHFTYLVNSSLNEYYYLNNFQNLVNSYGKLALFRLSLKITYKNILLVTLFELMVVNNWFILMEAFAIVSTEWSRLFFMTFYIITVVVITIVIAFVLEAFLFRMQYRDIMGDMDSKLHYLFTTRFY